MKNMAVIALLISLAITSYTLWNTQQQLSSTQDDALQFMELAGRASTFALATTQYNLGIINRDSLIIVRDHYEEYLGFVTVRWEGKK